MLLRSHMLGMMVALLLSAIFLDVLKAQSENKSASTYASAALLQAAPQQSSDQSAFSDWLLRR
jgi:hypothetical protein